MSVVIRDRSFSFSMVASKILDLAQQSQRVRKQNYAIVINSLQGDVLWPLHCTYASCRYSYGRTKQYNSFQNEHNFISRGEVQHVGVAFTGRF